MARIIAHFMHDEERDAALRLMTDVHETESFLFGEIDGDQIPRLQEQGVIVERVEQEPEAETPGKGMQISPEVRSRRQAPRPSPTEEPAVDSTGPNFYLIGLRGPLLQEWRQQLDALGVQLLAYVPQNNYTARLTPDQVQEVDTLPFVNTVQLYGPEDTGPIIDVAGISSSPSPGVGRAMLIYDVRLHREEDLRQVRGWLESRGVTIAGSSNRKLRLYLLEDSPITQEIAALPEVAELAQYVPPKLHNDTARVLLGIDHLPQSSMNPGLPQTGEGQIVAVADTGLDETHPDFQGRLVGIVALGRPGDATDPAGHGTHVAGSVLGDGSASQGKVRGAAPSAQLFFQSLLDANGELGGLPVDLGELFEEAYQNGARIHNNSWGAATNSMYTGDSIDVDEFVARRRDMLIVISAGNEGQAANRLNSAPGFVDWLSVGSPATSKNSLTVGASRTDRTAGGLAALTWNQTWPDNFPEPPIGDERVSGNPEGLAAFSSRGPSDDRRIKPDVVAPGTDIASAKSSRAPLREFWGAYPGNARYAFMGGTSMSAPLVSGCAALVREYYVKERNHDPSAALLKATLINGTRWLTGADSVADHPKMPNFHQGFGCVYIPWTIPNPSVPELKLEFADTWEDSPRQFNRIGQRIRFRFSVSGGDWLRICLTYTDLPARALQNNLDLIVEHRQSGKKWIGNMDVPMSLRIPDPDNNVEVVRLENPPAGDYLAQVSAKNLLQGGQDFALVVAGELGSPLIGV